MKKYIFSLIAVLLMFIAPNTVFASSVNINVSASNTAVLGNTVKVTVNLTSSSLIGSWQVDLSYDKSYLQLTNSTAEGGGTYMVNSSSTGTKSKSYTFTFKTLKNGNAKVSIASAMLFDYTTMGSMSVNKGSKTISIKTKAEIEASYSDNAYLSSLSIGDYALNPAFDKNTFEYTVEVEPDKESATISATKADSNASITGIGEVTLFEGSNKFEIVVTAQKGNTNKYVLNIIRKELEPVSVTVDGKSYMLVRNAKALSEYVGFSLSSVTYKGYEDVPALVNDTINYTIVGLKDNDIIKMFKFEDGEITQEYIELKNGNSIITPLKMKNSELFSKFYSLDDLSANISAKGYKVNDSYKIIYALDITDGEENYYLYNLDTNTFMIYDGSIEVLGKEKDKVYKYIIYGFMAFSGLLLLICLFGKSGNKKNKKDKKKKEETITEEIEEEYVEESVEDEEQIEEPEDVQEEKIEEKEEIETKELDIDEDTIEEEPKVDKKALKKQKAEEKRIAKEEKAKAKKAAKEEKKKLKNMDW